MQYVEFPGNVPYTMGERIEVWAAIPGHPKFKRQYAWQEGTVLNADSVRLDRGVTVGRTKWRKLKV